MDGSERQWEASGVDREAVLTPGSLSSTGGNNGAFDSGEGCGGRADSPSPPGRRPLTRPPARHSLAPLRLSDGPPAPVNLDHRLGSGEGPPVVVIAGPTASGKSALAVDLAVQFGGAVINADSMQVYRELHLLTARPPASDLARAPHALYGMLPGREQCSAGRWCEMAAAEIVVSRAAGRLPIVCGGTGLYLKALLEGLSPIPPIAPEVRMAARRDMLEMGNAAFHARLAARDPAMAARLAVGDTQRLIRAWEVIEGTGRSQADWHDEPPVRPVRGTFLVLLVSPPREVLYTACDGRFDLMMAYGALDEVRTLLSSGMPGDAPVMHALGVSELAAVLRGALPQEEAVAAAKQATRNFAKRQMTWFRGQLAPDAVVDAQYSESLRTEIFSIVRQFLLTVDA